MKKWARFEGNCAVEVINFDPSGLYHASIIWQEVPFDTTANSTFDGQQWKMTNWDFSDVDRRETLLTNIAMLQNDASATDRVDLYRAELAQVKDRINKAFEPQESALNEALGD